MKRTLTFMSLLLCVFATISAQTTVKRASNVATPFDQLESGVDYAIQVASDKNYQSRTDFSTAKFLCYTGSGTAYTEVRTSTTDCRYSEVSNNYTWTIIVNEDNTISIQSKNNGNYLPAPPADGHNGGTLASTGGKFTRVAFIEPNADWCYLTCNSTTGGATYFCSNGTAGEGNNDLQFWDFTDPTGSTNLSKFKFYKIEEVDASKLVSFTYQYTIGGENGKVVKTISRTGFTDCKYPVHEYQDLPDFITKVIYPEGNPKANETVKIQYDLSNYPFPFSVNIDDTPSWGYLTLNISTSGRTILTGGDTDIQRSAAGGQYQNATLNGVEKDLWRMVGDPFNGFKIINKSGKYLVKRSDNAGAVYSDASSTEDDNLWKIYKATIETESYITDSNKEELMNKAFAVRHKTVTSDQYLNSWFNGLKINPYGKNSNGSCMLFLEPEFSVDLHAATDASYATFCMPIDCKIVSTETTKAYTGKYQNGSLNMSEITNGIIPANEGVVLKNTDNNVTSVKFTANAKATAIPLENDLQGTTEEIAFANLSDKLVFGLSNNVVGFYAAGGTAALPANRAYLNKSLIGSAAAVAMNFNPVATGISNIRNNNKVNAPIYDLTGRRVFNTTKGNLYIQNGSKFIAR